MPKIKKKLSLLRGQRKKLGKAIEECLHKAKAILEDDDVSRGDLHTAQDVQSQKETLLQFLKKFEAITEKIAETADEDEDVDDDFEEDGSLAMDVTIEVTKVVSRLEAFQNTKQIDNPSGTASPTPETQYQEVLQRQIDGILEIERLRLRDEDRRRSSLGSSASQIRLPKIEFSKFNGEMIKWPEFWDSFEASVDRNESLQPVEKLSYLRSKLENDALATIEGLQTTNENYNVALHLLKRRYGNTQLLITTHYSQMMELAPAPNITPKLRELHDQMEKHLRCLEALGEDTSHRHFISLIMAKLPWQVVAKLEESKDEEEQWTVELLRKKLQNQLAARETADRQCPTKSMEHSRDKNVRASWNRDFVRRGTSETLFVGDQRTNNDFRFGSNNGMASQIRRRCIFCSANHWSDECRKVSTLEARKNAIKGRCYICLSDTHLLRDCNARNRDCVHCKQVGNHHRSLCPKKLFATPETSAMVPEYEETNEQGIAFSSSRHEEVLLASGEHVLLQTATCSIESTESKTPRAVKVRILLDSGSHRSYISEKLAKQLQLKPTKNECISVVTFGSSKPRTIQTRKTDVAITTIAGYRKEISVNIVPKISGSMSRSPVSFDPNNYLWKNIPLADSLPSSNEVSSIDCLIGSDYYLDIVTNDRIQVKEGLYLLGSKLGWILTGRTGLPKCGPDTSLYINSHVNCASKLSDHGLEMDSCVPVSPNVEEFWNLETIGIKDQIDKTDDELAVRQFADKICHKNGRYEVGWPWKEENGELMQNFQLAYGRFKSTCRRLSQDKDLLYKYDQIIKEQESKGIIERVDNTDDRSNRSRKHYIPHHPVINPKKIRIVYDASAKTNKFDKSLNECLLRGPVLLQDLCGLLLRFRLHSIVLLADIEKAFLQIGLREEDRDVTRFFWLKDATTAEPTHNVQIYRFCRVPFGMISSPFLLAATVKHHLGKSGSQVGTKLCEDIYVDNVVTGVESVPEAMKFYSEAKQLFNEAAMNLREWSSNNIEFLKLLPEKDKINTTDVKVLGLQWNRSRDTIQVTAKDERSQFRTITKREVLKRLAMNFDPLGFFVPVTLAAKLMIQKIWEARFGWDDSLPKDLADEWILIKDSLSQIPSVTVKRHIPAKRSKVARLLCFCDASAQAYATVIYLQFKNDNMWQSRLVFAKARISPKKKLSIPRLELLAVLIGTRSLKFVESQLRLEISEKVVWTDSKCVLHWIKAKKPLSVFVENRIVEIRKAQNLSFRYVNTAHNPADIATKVQRTDELSQNSLWWEGPMWLTQEPDEWPQWDFDSITSKEASDVSTEVRGSKVLYEAGMITNTSTNASPSSGVFTIDETRFSSLNRLLRVSAWILRFLRKLNPKICKPSAARGGSRGRLHHLSAEDHHLSAEELHEVRLLWERGVQQRYFKDIILKPATAKASNIQQQLNVRTDSDGIIRCCGRLENADIDENTKYPKLLPRKSHFTQLVIEHYHKILLHSGVSHTLGQLRMEYWIPQGRTAVRRVISQCITCRKQDGGPFKPPPMPQLPPYRVNPSPPFSFTGLDYFGPLYIKAPEDSVRKVWVCLFTCLCVRAIHLELVESLTAEHFLLALRRFIARRGTPIQLLSDNAPQFKAVDNTLRTLLARNSKSDDFIQFLTSKGITWKFIPEFAPWMGGLYERLIALVKNNLKKAVGRLCLTGQQLTATLTEVENVVNSRPLVYVGEDSKSPSLLTPASFLSLNPRQRLPLFEAEETLDPNYNPKFNSATSLRSLWAKGQQLLQSFWDVWQKEYLLSLRERYQSILKSPRVTVSAFPTTGQVVLIKDGQSPRGTWKTGIIVQLLRSSDGLVRSAKLRTSKQKFFVRPIRHLFPLEIPTQDCTANVQSSIPAEDGHHVDSASFSSKVEAADSASCGPLSTRTTKATQQFSIDEHSVSQGSPGRLNDEPTVATGQRGEPIKRKAFVQARHRIQKLLNNEEQS